MPCTHPLEVDLILEEDGSLSKRLVHRIPHDAKGDLGPAVVVVAVVLDAADAHLTVELRALVVQQPWEARRRGSASLASPRGRL